MNRLTDWMKKTIKRQESEESEESEEITGWQPIETAPKDGTVIDICGHWGDGKMNRVTNYYWGAYSYRHPDTYLWRRQFDPLNEQFTPTHWMPIPKLPVYVSPNSREGLKAEANRWVEEVKAGR